MEFNIKRFLNKIKLWDGTNTASITDDGKVNVKLSDPVQTQYSDSPSIDAFARLRVSNPVTLFDSQSQYNRRLLQFYEKTAGGGALVHNPNESSVSMNVTTSSGDTVIRQSKRYIRYQPSKSQLVFCTFSFNGTQTNTTKRVGYFDDENGIYLEDDGGTYSVVLRSNVTGSVVEERITRDNWDDSLDGNGPSGINYDLSKATIFMADIEWLGVGRVRNSLVIDGIPIPIINFNNAGFKPTTYMTTANLPIRWEIKTNGVNPSPDTFTSICSSVVSEGGFEESRGFPFSVQRVTPVNIGTTFTPLVSLRPKLLFNGITNRMELIKPQYDLGIENNNVIYQIIYNGTLTGDSFASVNSDSAVEYDFSATSISGGIVIDGGYLFAGTTNKNTGQIGGDLLSRLPFSLDIDGANPIKLTIVARTLSGTVDSYASMKWLELY